MANSSIVTLLANVAAAFGIPASLFVAQAQQESSLNPNAYNAKSGATGLLQLEPATAAQYGVTGSALLDPQTNATAGANYLSDLYAQFGDWTTALAAYDWGPTNVANAMAKYGANWMAYAPAETQNYVGNILGASGAPMATTAPQPVAPASVPVAAAPPNYMPDDSSADDDFADLLAPADDGTAAPAPNIFVLALIALGVYFAADFVFRESAG